MQSFTELFEVLERQRRRLEAGAIPEVVLDDLASRTVRRRRGCPDEQALYGFVAGYLGKRSRWLWLKVWWHVHVRRCRSCHTDTTELLDWVATSSLPQEVQSPPRLWSVVLRRARARFTRTRPQGQSLQRVLVSLALIALLSSLWAHWHHHCVQRRTPPAPQEATSARREGTREEPGRGCWCQESPTLPLETQGGLQTHASALSRAFGPQEVSQSTQAHRAPLQAQLSRQVPVSEEMTTGVLAPLSVNALAPRLHVESPAEAGQGSGFSWGASVLYHHLASARVAALGFDPGLREEPLHAQIDSVFLGAQTSPKGSSTAVFADVAPRQALAQLEALASVSSWDSVSVGRARTQFSATSWGGHGSHIRQAQARLAALGFDPGPLDGFFGPQTRHALRQYQVSRGLPVTWALDPSTQYALAGEPLLLRAQRVITQVITPATLVNVQYQRPLARLVDTLAQELTPQTLTRLSVEDNAALWTTVEYLAALIPQVEIVSEDLDHMRITLDHLTQRFELLNPWAPQVQALRQERDLLQQALTDAKAREAHLPQLLLEEQRQRRLLEGDAWCPPHSRGEG